MLSIVFQMVQRENDKANGAKTKTLVKSAERKFLKV